MKDFLTSALPWVAIGICVALLFANHAKKKKTASDEDAGENHMTDGMCVGMCLGVALGTTGVVNLAVGISMGMLLGMCVGMTIKK